MADVKLSTPHLLVILADGSSLEVQCTNADMVRFDLTRSKQKWPGAQDAPFLWLTFVAWAALRRTEQIEKTLAYESFADTTLEVRNLTDDESADDVERDAVGPTREAPALT